MFYSGTLPPSGCVPCIVPFAVARRIKGAEREYSSRNSCTRFGGAAHDVLFFARQRGVDRAERLPEIGAVGALGRGECRCADRHYRLGGRKRLGGVQRTTVVAPCPHGAPLPCTEGYPHRTDRLCGCGSGYRSGKLPVHTGPGGPQQPVGQTKAYEGQVYERQEQMYHGGTSENNSSKRRQL